MNLFNAIAVGFKEIWAHKFRSVLTMMGIILGVSSLVAMSALVKGMENGMREALIAIGGLEKVRVEEQDIPADQSHLAEEAVGTTMNDVYALERSAPLITMVTPEMRMQRPMLTRAGKSFMPFNFVGTSPNAVQMNKIMTTEVQNVVQSKKTAKQALDDAAAEWNKILAGGK